MASKKARRRYTDTEVRLAADFVDRLECVRVAMTHILKDYQNFKGITPESSDAMAALNVILKGNSLTGEHGIEDLEQHAIRGHGLMVGLETVMNGHPLGSWVERSYGIGGKAFARWYGAVTTEKRMVKLDKQGILRKGDIAPASNLLWYWDIQTGEWVERTHTKLWRHCGLDVGEDGRAPRKVKGGEFGHWNSNARTRAIIMADTAVMLSIRYACDECKAEKAERPEDESGWCAPALDCYCDELGYRYLLIYHRERLKWCDDEDKAGVGAKGHHHRHALRVVAKRIIKDAWQEAHKLNELGLYPGVDDLIQSSLIGVRGKPIWAKEIARPSEFDSVEDAVAAWTS